MHSVAIGVAGCNNGHTYLILPERFRTRKTEDFRETGQQAIDNFFVIGYYIYVNMFTKRSRYAQDNRQSGEQTDR